MHNLSSYTDPIHELSSLGSAQFQPWTPDHACANKTWPLAKTGISCVPNEFTTCSQNGQLRSLEETWEDQDINPKNHYPSLSIIVHHYQSLSIIIHHYPSLSIIIYHYTSLSIIAHHYPLFSFIIHHCPSLSIIIHHYPSLPIIIDNYPSLYIIIHHCPSLSIIFFHYP